MELRETVARRLYEELGYAADDPWDDAVSRRAEYQMDAHTSNQRQCLEAANAILDLPEIKEALVYRNVVLASRLPDLPPERVGEIIRGINASPSTER